MTHFILPIIILLASGAAFFTYIDPTYQQVKELRADEAQLDEALTRSREFQELRDDLQSRYNTFSSEDLERLEEMLPDTLDNVRLLLDMDGIASEYGMRLRNANINTGSTEQQGPTTRQYGSVELSFSVTAPYDQFKLFLNDLERSLRIVDITNLSVSPSGQAGSVDYNYDVTLRTYWLKK